MNTAAVPQRGSPSKVKFEALSPNGAAYTAAAKTPKIRDAARSARPSTAAFYRIL